MAFSPIPEILDELKLGKPIVLYIKDQGYVTLDVVKALVDAGLLIGEGEKRGRDYKASEGVMAIRERHRIRRPDDDPFAPPAEPQEVPDRQPSLFDVPRI